MDYSVLLALDEFVNVHISENVTVVYRVFSKRIGLALGKRPRSFDDGATYNQDAVSCCGTRYIPSVVRLNIRIHPLSK